MNPLKAEKEEGPHIREAFLSFYALSRAIRASIPGISSFLFS